ncbi:hypothetical protein [Rhodococcus sp. OK302]|uniref:hypothetical protein n=1 Tax=Rhodococcus sp. OK302 TaxID=1882769 RepID=UPI000B943467|nr:hypothetical protein [Rhodococcus sp. OK302]
MLNIVITDTNLGDGSHEIAELHEFRVSCHQALTEDSVLAVAAEADAILVQWAPITRRVLTSLPRLRVVVRYGIGLDNIDLDAAAELGIAVSNVDDYCLAEVADHAAAAIYAHNRRLTTSSRSFAERGWTTDGIDQPLPPAKTLLASRVSGVSVDLSPSGSGPSVSRFTSGIRTSPKCLIR